MEFRNLDKKSVATPSMIHVSNLPAEVCGFDILLEANVFGRDPQESVGT